jgi:hypothetical protein
MDRRMWLSERRAAVIAAYDAEAQDYDKHEYGTSPGTTTTRAVNKLSSGSSTKAWRSPTRASGKKAAGAIATSCCALAAECHRRRLHQDHETGSRFFYAAVTRP